MRCFMNNTKIVNAQQARAVCNYTAAHFKQILNFKRCSFMIINFVHFRNLIILMKATQYLHKCAGIVLLCQKNSLMMAPRCRNM